MLSKNTTMNNSYGIYDFSDDCIISANRITKNGQGIISGNKRNIVSGNAITINEYGFFGTVDHMTICGENIMNTVCGLFLMYSTDNNISGNTITTNRNAPAKNVPRT